ncbi:hypothetical protein Y032_1226g3771 [Ancylostoma ceylanicum]|uniref:Secreted protein n=1 Tax=Ancylostoma ceylanicum TaxID=53326 RepID=A0A016W6R0_9BILA|nr:hypothetical protein Y032_1226g3771 [Ancylostoma ceylanicum]
MYFRTRICRRYALLLLAALARGVHHGRRFYVRPAHFVNMDLRFLTFDTYLASLDNEQFHSYTRLYVDEFESLLARLVLRLSHAPTHLAPISPRHRLALCLR